MSRDEMIAVLINDTVERMVVMRQVFWLHGILENGFAGFAQWSDDELRRELAGRGFGSVDAIDSIEAIDYADEADFADEQDGEAFLRLAGHLGSNSQLGYLRE